MFPHCIRAFPTCGVITPQVPLLSHRVEASRLVLLYRNEDALPGVLHNGTATMFCVCGLFLLHTFRPIGLTTYPLANRNGRPPRSGSLCGLERPGFVSTLRLQDRASGQFHAPSPCVRATPTYDIIASLPGCSSCPITHSILDNLVHYTTPCRWRVLALSLWVLPPMSWRCGRSKRHLILFHGVDQAVFTSLSHRVAQGVQ